MVFAALALCALTGCMDSYDEPGQLTDDKTSATDIGEVNYSIAQLKSDRSDLFTQSNAFDSVTTDKIIEGVVCANDAGNNLYQTLVLRYIDTSKDADDPLRDQSIVLSLKGGGQYLRFPVGQRLKVNLKGLYVGCYSKLPKIGHPYYTSSGNLRLGPIPDTYWKDNIYKVGAPDATVAECQPIERDPAWLRATANRTYLNYPQLVTVRGSLKEADGEATYAPEDLEDAGYGVDRTITNTTNNTTVTLRTSTSSGIAFEIMPQGEHTFTGMLSYYNSWQVQLRTLSDVQAIQ